MALTKWTTIGSIGAEKIRNESQAIVVFILSLSKLNLEIFNSRPVNVVRFNSIDFVNSLRLEGEKSIWLRRFNLFCLHRSVMNRRDNFVFVFVLF